MEFVAVFAQFCFLLCFAIVFTNRLPFRHSKLAIGWKPSFKAINLQRSDNDSWRIHGLWPSVTKEEEKLVNDKQRYPRNFTEEDFQKIDKRTKKLLEKYWIYDFKFLTHQWKKHGVLYTEMSGMSQPAEWISKVLELFIEAKDALDKFLELVEPSEFLSLDVIKISKLWSNEWNHKIQIVCSFFATESLRKLPVETILEQLDQTFLSEIYLCYDLNWNIIDCEQKIRFCNRVVIFPPFWNPDEMKAEDFISEFLISPFLFSTLTVSWNPYYKVSNSQIPSGGQPKWTIKKFDVFVEDIAKTWLPEEIIAATTRYDRKSFSELEEQLNEHWPSLSASYTNRGFQYRCWKRDGRYFLADSRLNSPTKYFTNVLRLFHSLKLRRIFRKFKADTEIAVDDITNRILEKLGVRVTLDCDIFDDVSYLMDITFCFDENLELVNCDENQPFCLEYVQLALFETDEETEQWEVYQQWQNNNANETMQVDYDFDEALQEENMAEGVQELVDTDPSVTKKTRQKRKRKHHDML